MDIIVCKFGGTSAANGDCFRQIKRILDSDPRRRYVVLSAPGADGTSPKVTDLLIRLWEGRLEYMDAVVARFEAIGSEIGLSDTSERVRHALWEALSVSRAQLVSRGEALCAALFSEYAGLPLVDAAEIIRFDRADRLDAPETLRRVRAMSLRYPRAVIPGFYGANPDGTTALFPRNGSDITGALVAAGVGASLYENWTDVPGLMTGDPALCPDAKVIPEISYADMQRLAKDGATILHPDCLAPVESAGIPTRLKCTFTPGAPGTLIR